MKKFLFLLIALTLPACSNLKTPEDRYLALTTTATIAVDVAQNYVNECKQKPSADPCYNKFPKINSSAKILKKTKDQADRIFITHDSGYYDLSLGILENALVDLTAIMKE